jgi:hypothetical protein
MGAFMPSDPELIKKKQMLLFMDTTDSLSSRVWLNSAIMLNSLLFYALDSIVNTQSLCDWCPHTGTYNCLYQLNGAVQIESENRIVIQGR